MWAQNFTLKDVDGNDFNLVDHAGKVIILNFLMTTCSVCLSEIPGLIAAYNQYEKQDLIIVGIVMDPAKIQPFQDTFKIPYPLLAYEPGAVDYYGPINTVPVNVLITREGEVVSIKERYVSYDELIEAIEALI